MERKWRENEEMKRVRENGERIENEKMERKWRKN